MGDIVNLDVTIFVLVNLDVPSNLDVANNSVLNLDVANNSNIKSRRTQQIFVKFRRSESRCNSVYSVVRYMYVERVYSRYGVQGELAASGARGIGARG